MNWSRPLTLIAVAAFGFACVPTLQAQSSPPSALLVVITPESITFEGKPVHWDELKQQLQAVPDRDSVVLQLAVSTDEITLARLKDARSRLTDLAAQLGIRSVQYVGERETGDRTTPVQLEVVNVSQDPDAEFQSIQQALDAVAPGGLVRIGPGRYEERIVIRRPVRIVGAGWDHTTIAGPEWTQPSPELVRSFRERLQAANTDEERRSIEAEARKWIEESGASLNTPVVQILGADGVSCEGVKFSLPGIPRKNSGLPGTSVLRIEDSRVQLTDCAVLGSPGNGIEVAGGSQFKISHCLVAAVWNTGIAVGDAASASITNCDVRNCYHRCITIGIGHNPCTVRNCRISGSAWHGIRYDSASPTIEHNIISGNARSGIYASGSTQAIVRNNLFFANEMDGISCWFNNRDTIESNTFAANRREAIAILGASEPTIERNVLFDSPVGVQVSFISGNGSSNEPPEARHVDHNWFWKTERDVVAATRDADTSEAGEQVIAAADEGEGNLESDPGFAGDGFSLADDSPARAAGVGATEFPALASPFPLQPEEEAIVPRTETRDWNAWRRPE
jgi:parallel beta-helix repeat protein